MGRGVRLDRFGFGLLALALAAEPVAAQDAAPVTNPASNGPASQVVGRQLQDFNLNGTVTRPAAPSTTTQPARTTPVATQPPPRPSERTVTTERSSRSPAPAASQSIAQRSPGIAAAQPTIAPQPQVQQATVADRPAAAPALDLPVTVLPGEPAPNFTLWPWLLAAIAAAGGALLLFRRHLQRDRYVAAGVADPLFDLSPSPESAAEPLRRAPVAMPPAKPATTGIVSTRLHPDLDIDLLPERAVVDEHGATIEFQVAVRNHGTAPARDVHVEACMVNAGPAQDQELGAFFAHPGSRGDPIPQILPMTEIMLKSTVRLPAEMMRQFEVGGRKLFVPLVGVNAVYRGPAGPAQTSASYLVGRDSKGEKMAPFRLDLGPRIFRGLGARQHTLGLRK